MASDTITVGDGGTNASRLSFPANNTRIAPALIVGGAAAYINSFRFQVAGGIILISINLSSTPGGPGSQAGPDFTSAVEDRLDAFMLAAPGIGSVTIPGPNNSSATRRDPSEPYSYIASVPGFTRWASRYVALAPASRAQATLTIDDGALPQALAPAVEITGPRTVAQGDTIRLSAVLTGGRYDRVDGYDWTVVSGGGSISGTGTTVDLAGVTPGVVRVGLDVRVSGDGTAVGDGTTATGQATLDVTVTKELPRVSAPDVSLTGPNAVRENTDADFTAVLSGGNYDEVSGYDFSVTEGNGAFTGSGATQTYRHPGVTGQTLVRIRSSVTVIGNGTNYRVGSSVTVIAYRSFYVYAQALPTPAGDVVKLADAQGRSLVGDDPLYAIEINHPAVGDAVRIVNATEQHTIDGDVYQPVRFNAVEPQDAEREVRHATLRVDNVGAVLTQWIEATRGGTGANLRIMKIVDNAGIDEIYWEQAMTVGLIEYNARDVQITLSDEPVHGKPAVLYRHDPETSPGIFR